MAKVKFSVDHSVFEQYSQSIRKVAERIKELMDEKSMRLIDLDVALIAGYSWDEETILDPDGTIWDRCGEEAIALEDVIPDYSTDLYAAWIVAAGAFDGVGVSLGYDESDGGHRCTIRSASRSVVARDESPAMAVCLAIVEYARLMGGERTSSPSPPNPMRSKRVDTRT